ncbi:MAG: ferric reductase-like transmembrane domain-containing protein, partial [Albidovulum sp.]
MFRKAPSPWTLAILYAAAVMLPIALAFLTVGRGVGGFTRAGIAAGIAAFAMLLTQMVTSGRFERLSGRLGIDVTMGFHKWAGPAALAFAFAHPLLLIGPADAERPHRQANRLAAMLEAPGLTDARIALILLVLIIALALLRDRLPFRYESWRASHALVALALVATLIWHTISDGRAGDSWGAVFWPAAAAGAILPALWVYLRRLHGAGSGWVVDENHRIADRLWQVTIRPQGARPISHHPGQFAWLAFGRCRVPLCDHPFSIASAPALDGSLRFLIQEAGDFTARIGTVPPGTKVALDGPHGSFCLDEKDSDKAVLLIAGGVGIAPILAILGALARQGVGRPVRLVYACRDAASMVPATLWKTDLDRIGGRAILLTDTAPDRAGVAQGPMTLDHVRDAMAGLDPARTVAFLCGPGGMMARAADCLEDCGLPARAIRFERFRYDAQ